MIPDRNPDLIRAQNPKLWATAESNRVVIENRRDDQGPVQNGSHEKGVLELSKLVAEATVGSVPEELLSSEGAAIWGNGK